MTDNYLNNIGEKPEQVLLIIPSLDPDHHLIETVEGMLQQGFSRILLINDGSDKEHLQPFEELAKHPEVTVIGYEENKGKGHALKMGFQWALDNCPELCGVVTADGDGQHAPKDTAAVALHLLREPDKVILGCRNFLQKGVPLRNRLGNLITKAVFGLLYGLHIGDAQTGLRALPMGFLADFRKVEGERFEYESNLFIAMKDKGIGYVNHPIETIYIDEGRGSHFRPLQDSVRIFKPILLFACSGSSATLIDLGVFTLLIWMLGDASLKKNVFIATAVARVLSCSVNFFVNRNKVFRSSKPASVTLLRYCLLAVCIMLASYKGVSLLTDALSIEGLGATLIKMCVDTCLSIINFRVQRTWVF